MINKGTVKNLLYEVLPIDLYLKIIYRWYHKKPLNIKKPKRYTEKLYWLKKYNGRPENVELIRRVYDKYRARSYIAEKGYEKYLPKLYGVYENSSEIDFNNLPEKYVLKISQSNGSNYICNGASQIDDEELRKIIDSWQNEAKNRKFVTNRYREEAYYYDGNPKIVCEEYLSKNDGSPCQEVRVFCFNGEPKLISGEINYHDENGCVNKVYNRNTFDTNWNLVPVDMGRPRNEEVILEKPKELNKILEISKALSNDFVFARVDFYLGEEVHVGEITFIPQGASKPIEPSEYDDLLGSWLKLPL